MLIIHGFIILRNYSCKIRNYPCKIHFYPVIVHHGKTFILFVVYYYQVNTLLFGLYLKK